MVVVEGEWGREEDMEAGGGSGVLEGDMEIV